MRYRNMKTGAVINTPCTISGKDWKEISPAGFSLPKEKKEEVQEEPKEPVVEEKVSEPEEPKKEESQKAEKKGGGAVIRPKKGK